MITLKEYIFHKYGGKCVTMTQDETVAFGVAYPLESGWFMDNCENRLSELSMINLYKTTYVKSKAISGLYIDKPSANATYAQKTVDALAGLFGNDGMFDFINIEIAEDKPVVNNIKPLTAKERRKVRKQKKKGFQYEKVKPVPKAKKKKAVRVGTKPSFSDVSYIINKCPVDVRTDAFLNTFEWKALRMQALTKYGAKCQCCGASPSTGAVMHVDHIKPRKFYPDLALVLDNLQILCGDCNRGKGNWDTTDWRDK